jgi:hypothetical protein
MVGRIRPGCSVAIRLEFDAVNNILRGTLHGPINRDVMLGLSAAIGEYTRSHPPFSCIVDLSGVTESKVSSDDVRQRAEAPPLFPTGYKQVLVISSDSVFGMGRMYKTLAERSRPGLHVVRTMDEAYRLLDVKIPDFHPVS